MAAKKKKAVKSRKRKPAVVWKGKCTPANICRYLDAWDKYWRLTILPRYLQGEKAICHLERVVLDQRAPNPLLRRCGGAGGNVEPADPPLPPNW